MKTKTFAITILITLCTLILFSCAPSDEVKTPDIITSSDDGLAIPVETEPDLYADLPNDNYEGYNFRILNNESNFALTQMDSREQNGEPINDAIYDRNRLVEERLNITIQENMVTYSEVTSTITKAIAAGEDAYDIFFNESYFVAPLVFGKLSCKCLRNRYI